ncbi:hypothetical protein [Enterococcus sp. HY326]|uniref:hypothetical protein n=1 Tax=Enterococcus sp. HY326 TaxID=2971265 RepID=UPI0022406C9B|nr:hypothetical protein [Enterococcus sp. HY326]
MKKTSEEIYAKRFHQSKVSRELVIKAALKNFHEDPENQRPKTKIRYKLTKSARLFE